MGTGSELRAVSFDLFGTLVDASPPRDPAAAVAAELESREVAVPEDWSEAYARPHVDAPVGAEVPLAAHVRAALASRGVYPTGDERKDAIRRAVLAAFEPGVETRDGAPEAVATAADRGPVCVLSNCSVRGLARQAIERSRLDLDAFECIVTSVECGWRKPDRRAFEAVAGELGVPLSNIVHVGDDPNADGAAAEVGARAILLEETPLRELPALMERSA
jgi:HAD superfamily hydrolase (TIGR01549 family)